jgi:hypothetical protein
MDAVGRTVLTGRTHGQRTTLDLSGLGEGSYLLRLELPSGSATERLTLTR